MKRINDHMDATKPNNFGAGDCCTSYLHKVFQEADTATSREEVDHISGSLQNIQGQCCQLIYNLSINESINRANVGDLPTDFIESENNDLITFIAGVGVACGDVVDRLAAFESSEYLHDAKQTGGTRL